MTRTLKVRLDIDNPSEALKPDMYADVEFHVSLPATLTVPAEAVLDSGERKTVLVDRGDGYFEPRQVITGERADSRIRFFRASAKVSAWLLRGASSSIPKARCGRPPGGWKAMINTIIEFRPITG